MPFAKGWGPYSLVRYILQYYERGNAGLEIRGILVTNATMFSHLLPGFSCGSKHLLLP